MSTAIRLAAMLGLLLIPTTAAAQTATATTGVVSGIITDSTGGVLPGVAIVLIDENTGASRETVSTDSGHYSFISVLPGRYRITATLQGFQQTLISDVVVEVNKILSVDVKLAVGQLTESV